MTTAHLMYLDVCCLKRPFDDQRQERIRHEATAVATIIGLAEQGKVTLIRSGAHTFENGRNPREDRRLAAALWLDSASVEVPLSSAVEGRARALGEVGFRAMDALHIAFAEAAGARWLVTTDDRMLAIASRSRSELTVRVVNPRTLLAHLQETRDA